MNIKKATYSQVSTSDCKKKKKRKASKQPEYRYDIICRVISWDGEGGNGTGIRQQN